MADTSATIRVRDHRRPCKHGSLRPHRLAVADAEWRQEPECLGGGEMILRQLPDGLWEQVPEKDERTG